MLMLLVAPSAPYVTKLKPTGSLLLVGIEIEPLAHKHPLKQHSQFLGRGPVGVRLQYRHTITYGSSHVLTFLSASGQHRRGWRLALFLFPPPPRKWRRSRRGSRRSLLRVPPLAAHLPPRGGDRCSPTSRR